MAAQRPPLVPCPSTTVAVAAPVVPRRLAGRLIAPARAVAGAPPIGAGAAGPRPVGALEAAAPPRATAGPMGAGVGALPRPAMLGRFGAACPLHVAVPRVGGFAVVAEVVAVAVVAAPRRRLDPALDPRVGAPAEPRAPDAGGAARPRQAQRAATVAVAPRLPTTTKSCEARTGAEYVAAVAGARHPKVGAPLDAEAGQPPPVAAVAAAVGRVDGPGVEGRRRTTGPGQATLAAAAPLLRVVAGVPPVLEGPLTPPIERTAAAAAGAVARA